MVGSECKYLRDDTVGGVHPGADEPGWPAPPPLPRTKGIADGKV